MGIMSVSKSCAAASRGCMLRLTMHQWSLGASDAFCAVAPASGQSRVMAHQMPYVLKHLQQVRVVLQQDYLFDEKLNARNT